MPRQQCPERVVSGVGPVRDGASAAQRFTPRLERSEPRDLVGLSRYRQRWRRAAAAYRRCFRCQTGSPDAGVVDPPTARSPACGQVTTYCRELPDVALDANPDTGYIVYCTTPDCQAAGGRCSAAPVQRTPLLAAMTADANGYSLAHGGGRLGFASPFLYSHAGTGLFRDVTAGSNSIDRRTGVSGGSGLRHGDRSRCTRRRTTRHHPGRRHRIAVNLRCHILDRDRIGEHASAPPRRSLSRARCRTRLPGSRWHPGR